MGKEEENNGSTGDIRFIPDISAWHDFQFEQNGNSAYQLKNFLGNFSPDFLNQLWYEKASPEDIAAEVNKVMVRDIVLFEKERIGDELKFKTDDEGQLIPIEGAEETHNVTITEFQELYDACQKPITYEELLALTTPLQAKLDFIKETGGIYFGR